MSAGADIGRTLRARSAILTIVNDTLQASSSLFLQSIFTGF